MFKPGISNVETRGLEDRYFNLQCNLKVTFACLFLKRDEKFEHGAFDAKCYPETKRSFDNGKVLIMKRNIQNFSKTFFHLRETNEITQILHIIEAKQMF